MAKTRLENRIINFLIPGRLDALLYSLAVGICFAIGAAIVIRLQNESPDSDWSALAGLIFNEKYVNLLGFFLGGTIGVAAGFLFQALSNRLRTSKVIVLSVATTLCVFAFFWSAFNNQIVKTPSNRMPQLKDIGMLYVSWKWLTWSFVLIAAIVAVCLLSRLLIRFLNRKREFKLKRIHLLLFCAVSAATAIILRDVFFHNVLLPDRTSILAGNTWQPALFFWFFPGCHYPGSVAYLASKTSLSTF